MSGFKRLIHEIHRRSLWQVLGIYLVGAWIGYEVIQSLTEGLGLPSWLPGVAIVLFIIGLPIVLATAFVQEGLSPAARQDPTLLPGAETMPEGGRPEGGDVQRLFTWRNAITGGVLAFALWGVVATGWLFFHDTGSRSAPEHITSIAVLPLKNLSADPEQEYFTDGMTEALTAELAQIQALRVISRTSAMRFKGTDKSVPEIARELNVDAVVEGAVMRSGDRVRITAQLIHAPTDRHLWAESYDRDLRDVLALHSAVARAIAQEIKVKLRPEEQARLASTRPVDPEAYEAYLKGRFYHEKFTEDNWKKAIQYFETAIEKDPGYAPAYAGLATSYSMLGFLGHLPPQEASRESKAAVVRALEIDESLADAHSTLGLLKMNYDWDWPGAERKLKRAIALSPNLARAHHGYAISLARVARLDEANSEITRARELDPLSVQINNDVAWIAYLARDNDRAIEQYRNTLELDPTYAMAHRELGWVYMQEGRYDDAMEESESAVSLSSDDFTLASLGRIYAVAGEREKALDILDELKARSQGRYLSPVNVALVYVGLGQKDDAFAWLNKAYEERAGFLSNLKQHPLFDSLRSDPRFTELLEKVGLE